MSDWSGEEPIIELAESLPLKQWTRIVVNGVAYDALNQGVYTWPDDVKNSGAQKRTEEQ